MSDTPTPPALSPELWEELKDGIEAIEVLPTTKGGMLVAMAPRPLGKHGHRAVTIESISQERHAAAALCLYAQPWGFSSEDVEALRAIAPGALDIDAEIKAEGASVAILGEHLARIRSLASRIASLLPPTS